MTAHLWLGLAIFTTPLALSLLGVHRSHRRSRVLQIEVAEVRRRMGVKS